MVIEILGAKDAQTDKLLQNVKIVLQKNQAFAKIRLITDPRKISTFGPLMLPALILNGTVAVNGRVPLTGELEKLIKKEMGR